MYWHDLLALRLGNATADAELVRLAIVHIRRAVEICQERGRDRGMYLNNLSGAVAMVYWLTGDVESLHGTVAVARAAVAATHAEYSGRLAHLAPLDAALAPGRGELGTLR
jgi:hypothetical protein